MELAPSLHQIGSDMVNVYIIEDERGADRHRLRPAGAVG